MMRKTIPAILLLTVFIAACETQGDKFPVFSVKEALLGTIKDHQVKKAFFINERTGFVAISNDTILKTNDSCKTFSLSLTDRSAFFERIQFVNDTLGFVIDRSNKIYRTLDGGKTWLKTYISAPGASLLDLTCINPDTIFMVAGGLPGLQKGYIIKSVDGGVTWMTLTSINLMNIDFLDNSAGFAAGYGGVVKTLDCGKSWEPVSSMPSNDICFFDTENGYLSAGRSLFKTTDGGKNWKLVKKIINPHWIMGEDFSKIEGLSRINEYDLIFTLNARLIKVTRDRKWYQHAFTRPYYQLQMIGRDKGIVYGFENIILVRF